MKRRSHAAFGFFAALLTAASAQAGLRESAHNLGPGGAAGRRAASGETSATAMSDDLCVFCHTPHSAVGRRGLWNRAAPPTIYKLYESSTSEAHLQQPTGSSRLCLSCHDGMIALGALKHHGDPSLGKLTGDSVLGTDLSDDHPISFVYDRSLTARRRELAQPPAPGGAVKLDETGQMQCTTCHDAHVDRFPPFLVMDPAHSSLCSVCHRLENWPESAHATSPALLPLGGESERRFATVGEAGCSACHRSHGAPHPEFLLAEASEEKLCLDCHDGGTAATDLRRESMQPSAHRVDRYRDVHDPTENPNTMPPHVECVDCHSPHQARPVGDARPLPGPLTGVSGLSVDGSFLREASFEYEVCLKCHGVAEAREPVVFRDDPTTNVRLLIDPRNASFHPIADIGRNSMVSGLISPLTPASRIACTSCHDSDSARRGGTAKGPHGSIYRPILAAEYHFDATTAPESFQRYALCYGCHDRNALLGDTSGFPHRLHVDQLGASCAVCHDAHGARQNQHLVNFMTRDITGEAVVTSSSSGVLAFDAIGPRSGRCFLTCHGSNHDPLGYPQVPAGMAPLGRLAPGRR